MDFGDIILIAYEKDVLVFTAVYNIVPKSILNTKYFCKSISNTNTTDTKYTVIFVS